MAVRKSIKTDVYKYILKNTHLSQEYFLMNLQNTMVCGYIQSSLISLRYWENINTDIKYNLKNSYPSLFQRNFIDLESRNNIYIFILQGAQCLYLFQIGNEHRQYNFTFVFLSLLSFVFIPNVNTQLLENNGSVLVLWRVQPKCQRSSVYEEGLSGNHRS